MKEVIRQVSRGACYWSFVVALPIVCTKCDVAAEDVTEPPATCELKIDGKHIEKLTLVDKGDARREFSQPNGSVSLPPGEYRIEEVKLEGGYSHHAWGHGEWFSLTPDRVHRLAIGAPLIPRLEITRTGRIVRLDHQLVDAAGRNYHFRGVGSSPDAPRLAVCRADRQIGAGSFEYG